MPDIRLIREGIPNLLPMTSRTNTVHVSDIIHYLCVSLGHYEPSEANPTRLQLGCAVEDTIAARYVEHYPDRYVRLPEVIDEESGIAGTGDIGDLIDEAVEECKLTWMSTKQGVDSEKLWKFIVQLKAYCYLYGWVIGRLHVCYINGDYSYTNESGGPQYRVWEFRFTEREVRDNWTMLMRNRDKAAEWIGMVRDDNGIWRRLERLED